MARDDFELPKLSKIFSEKTSRVCWEAEEEARSSERKNEKKFRWKLKLNVAKKFDEILMRKFDEKLPAKNLEHSDGKFCETFPI